MPNTSELKSIALMDCQTKSSYLVKKKLFLNLQCLPSFSISGSKIGLVSQLEPVCLVCSWRYKLYVLHLEPVIPSVLV